MPTSIGTWIQGARSRTTLGQQLAFYTGLLSLILVGGLAWLAGETARQQAVTRIQGSMNALATSISDRLGMFLDDRYRDVSQVSQFAPLSAVWTQGPEAIRPVLEQMQDGFPAYTWIGFASLDGTVVAATGGLLEGQSVAERPWFVDGLKTGVIEDVHDAKLLAPLLEPNPTGEPYRFVDVAVPVSDGTRIVGVVGAHLSWKWADDVRNIVLSRLDPKHRTDVWILNAEGAALLGPATGSFPFSLEIIDTVRKDGRVTFVDDHGSPVLTSVVLTSPNGTPRKPAWMVVARRPLAVAFAEADQIAGNIGLTGLAMGVLGIIAAVLLAARLSSPLRKLAARVDLIGRDPNVTMVRREQGSKEIVQLSSSIRSLLRRVASAEGAEVEARRTASAIEQRMEEKTRQLGEHISTLQTLADTDPLTKLLNRRAFLGFAHDAMDHFKRFRREIAILVIDIDLFKRVNDTYGHATGDQVIEAVAGAIKAELRSTDKVGRFGGEEFVVLLRETDSAGAVAIAERIRGQIAGRTVESLERDSVHVTVSIGLAMSLSGDRDIEDIIERADRALYEAKQAGRNVVVADVGRRMVDAAE